MPSPRPTEQRGGGQEAATPPGACPARERPGPTPYLLETLSDASLLRYLEEMRKPPDPGTHGTGEAGGEVCRTCGFASRTFARGRDGTGTEATAPCAVCGGRVHWACAMLDGNNWLPRAPGHPTSVTCGDCLCRLRREGRPRLTTAKTAAQLPETPRTVFLEGFISRAVQEEIARAAAELGGAEADVPRPRGRLLVREVQAQRNAGHPSPLFDAAFPEAGPPGPYLERTTLVFQQDGNDALPVILLGLIANESDERTPQPHREWAEITYVESTRHLDLDPPPPPSSAAALSDAPGGPEQQSPGSAGGGHTTRRSKRRRPGPSASPPPGDGMPERAAEEPPLKAPVSQAAARPQVMTMSTVVAGALLSGQLAWWAAAGRRVVSLWSWPPGDGRAYMFLGPTRPTAINRSKLLAWHRNWLARAAEAPDSAVASVSDGLPGLTWRLKDMPRFKGQWWLRRAEEMLGRANPPVTLQQLEKRLVKKAKDERQVGHFLRIELQPPRVPPPAASQGVLEEEEERPNASCPDREALLALQCSLGLSFQTRRLAIYSSAVLISRLHHGLKQGAPELEPDAGAHDNENTAEAAAAAGAITAPLSEGAAQ